MKTSRKNKRYRALSIIFFTVWLLLIFRYAGGNPDSSWPTSDAVIFSLMAKHMMEGEAFNWYFYGQDYMGTLPVLIIMGLFKLWGISHLWVEMFIAAIYAATLTLVSAFLWRQIGFFAAWISAVLYCLFPTEQDVLAALDSGTHNFSIFTGLLCSYLFCLLLERYLQTDSKHSAISYLGWATVCLLGILTYWSSKLGMAYVIPIVGLALFSVRKKLGRVILTPVSALGGDKYWQSFSHWVWLILICLAFTILLMLEKGLFNLRLIIEIYFFYLFDKIESPWDWLWSMATIIAMALFLWFERKRLQSMLNGNLPEIPWHLLLLSIPLFNLIIALPTTDHLDDYTSARYFESFQWASLIAVPLLISCFFKGLGRNFLNLIYLAVAISTWYSPDEEDYDRISQPIETLEYIIERQEDITRLRVDEKAALEFLQQRQLFYGYGDYWLAYRLSYLTHEKMIISPYIESRYEPYDKKIETQGVGFFIFNIFELADGREFAQKHGMLNEKIFGEIILFY